MDKKMVQIVIRVPQELADFIDFIASLDGRRRTKQVVHILEQYYRDYSNAKVDQTEANTDVHNEEELALRSEPEKDPLPPPEPQEETEEIGEEIE